MSVGSHRVRCSAGQCALLVVFHEPVELSVFGIDELVAEDDLVPLLTCNLYDFAIIIIISGSLS